MQFDKDLFDKAGLSLNEETRTPASSETIGSMADIMMTCQKTGAFKTCEFALRELGSISALRMAMGIGFQLGRRYEELAMLEGMVK
jgi:hypothetical protein